MPCGRGCVLWIYVGHAWGSTNVYGRGRGCVFLCDHAESGVGRGDDHVRVHVRAHGDDGGDHAHAHARGRGRGRVADVYAHDDPLIRNGVVAHGWNDVEGHVAQRSSVCINNTISQ